MKLYQEGPRTADVMIVGEAPGRQEVEKGRPFINGSGAGDVLDKCLSLAGIDRVTTFVTNVCHVQPPGNDFKWFYKAGKDHLEAGLMQLATDILSIKPKLIVALGADPLFMLTGKSGITKWRGSVLPCSLIPGFKVLPTYHPASALRVYPNRAMIAADFQRIPVQREFREIRYPKRTLYLPDSTWVRDGTTWKNIDSVPDHVQIAHEMLEADWLATDIENWEDWTLSCVGFSDRSDRALTLDWSIPEQRQLIKLLCESGCWKVLQNGSYDQVILAGNHVSLERFKWDTMLAHHVLLPESASGADEMSALAKRKRVNTFAKGLAFQTSIYTDEPHYKEDGKLWKRTNDIHAFWRYNALDAATTFDIRVEQERQIESRGLQEPLRRQFDLIQPLIHITARGIPIDLDQRARLREKFEADIVRMDEELTKQAGGPINVKSSKQAQDLLYNRLGLPKQHHRKTGAVTADKFAITALAEKFKHPVLLGMLALREKRDFVERYLDATVDNDGMMRCSLDPTGTNTWRLASRQSVYGSGTNLQNIPARRPEGRQLRRMFVASSPEKVLFYPDYSQAEARIVAHMARCEGLIELFDDPTRDVHSENASRIFNIPLASVGKDSIERFLAKQGVHAGNYGQGPKDLARRINAEAEYTGIRVTEKECEDIQRRVHMIYPEIKGVYWREVENELRRSRELSNPFGYKRRFHDRWDDKLLRTAYAFKPQSTVGILCCMALVRAYYEIERKRPELGVAIFLNVHDALLLEGNTVNVAEIAKEVQRCMAIPIPINGKEVYIPTDVKVGGNWDIYNKKDPNDNPKGMRDLDAWLEAA